jgi:hypothetical protein
MILKGINMFKFLLRFSSLATLSLAVLALFGCGSGGGTGGASNMTITLSGLSSTTMESGTNVSGTVSIQADAAGLNGVNVSIKTDNSFVTGVSSDTDNTGNASFVLSASPLADLSKTVKVWAEYDGVRSNILEINLKSYIESSTFDFTISSTAEFSRTANNNTSASAANIVVTGNQIVFKGPAGAVVSAPVEISIDSINNYAVGDVVTVGGTTTFEGVNPLNFVSFTINTVDGVVNIPTTYSVVLPAAASVAGVSTSHVYSVTWRAKVTYNGMVYYKTATTSVTGTTVSQDPPTTP